MAYSFHLLSQRHAGEVWKAAAFHIVVVKLSLADHNKPQCHKDNKCPDMHAVTINTERNMWHMWIRKTRIQNTEISRLIGLNAKNMIFFHEWIEIWCTAIRWVYYEKLYLYRMEDQSKEMINKTGDVVVIFMPSSLFGLPFKKSLFVFKDLQVTYVPSVHNLGALEIRLIPRYLTFTHLYTYTMTEGRMVSVVDCRQFSTTYFQSSPTGPQTWLVIHLWPIS